MTRARVATALILPFLILAGLLTINPGRAAADPGAPDACPNIPVIHAGCKLVTGAVEGGVTGGPAGAVGGAAKAVVGGTLGGFGSAFAKVVADSAVWFLKQAHKAITDTTTPDLTRPWFIEHYRMMWPLAFVLGVILLILAASSAGLRRDGRTLKYAVAAVPAGFLGAGIATYVVQAMVFVASWMANQVGRTIGKDLGTFTRHAELALQHPGGIPVLALGFGFMVALVGAGLIWVDQLLRADAIYVLSVFMPVVFMLLILPATRRWVKRTVEVLAIFVFSWPVLVTIASVAMAAMADAPKEGASGGELGSLFAGGAMLCLAVFTPLALIRGLPFMEAQASGAMAHRKELKQATGAEKAGQQSHKVVETAIRKSTSSGGGAGGAGGAKAVAGPAGGASAAAGPAGVASFAAAQAKKLAQDRATGATASTGNAAASAGKPTSPPPPSGPPPAPSTRKDKP